MNYPSINEYKEAILFAEDNFEQLKNLRPVLDDDGSPVMTSGNFAVVFKMKDEQTGKLYAVKCFLREQEGRAEAYRMIAEELEYVSSTFLTPIKYLDKELFVDTNAGDEKEFPVLLMDWVEGDTLDKYIRKHLDDQYELSLIAYQFSRLAMWLMPQPFAHGDLKPDNILVKDDGTLVLVDYDGMYVPAMKGQKARELGSPDFRHPSRTETDFNEHIDDFSLASILLSLKAISLQPELLEEYGASDRLLLSEEDYRNISQSRFFKDFFPSDIMELNKLMNLFMLALSEFNLSSVSSSMFNIQNPIIEFYSTKVTGEDLTNVWIDDYGVMYSSDKKVLKKVPPKIIYYSIIEGTEIIGDAAFSYSEKLESVMIPKSVREIGHNAFTGCINLHTIILSENVKSIKGAAFENCKSLWSVIIRSPNDSNKHIQLCRDAFAGCESIAYFEWPEANRTTLYTYLSDSDRIEKVVGEDGDIEAEKVLREDEMNFKAMSMFYNSIGMNITKVRGNCKDEKSFKNIDKDWPHSLEEFYNNSQSKSFIISENWYRCSGIGLVLGWNKYRAIDVDHVGYYYEDNIDSVIENLLSHMDLPKDYPWVVKSGSGRGFHIIFTSELLKNEQATKAYTPNFRYAYYGSDLVYFDRLELRWKDHLILPPSIHFSGKRYEFWHGIPNSEPTSLQIYNIDSLIFHYCGRINIQKYNFNGKAIYLVETCKYYTTFDNYGFFEHGKVPDSFEWQEKSNTPEANNSIGIRYVLGNNVNVNKEKALHHFVLSDSDVSNYNIASLIACEFFEGSQKDVEKYLSRIKDDHTFSLVNYDTYDKSIPEKLYQQVRLNYADLPNE